MTGRTEANRRYRQSPEGRAKTLEAKRRYKASPAGRAAKARHKASPAGRAAKARYRTTDTGKAGKAQTKRNAMDRRPFVGIDGEGGGFDEHGRQLYLLMRAKGGDYDAELFTGRPLTTASCLRFITNLPRDAIISGFSFGYDAAMIMRDLPEKQLRRVFADKEIGPGKSRYAWYRDFGIEYMPKNYFRVCLTRPVIRTREDGSQYRTVETIPGSSRTVWESFGFFQKSFLKAIDAFDVATPDERDFIDRMKKLRAAFTADITPEIRNYCGLECDLQARMMTEFRRLCLAVDIRPRTWNGAGKLSAALHTKFGTMTAARLAELVPADVLNMADAAYYGGRFEVTRTGIIQGPIYEYDIQSAYPAAMTTLPCLEHGRWEAAPIKWLREPPRGAVYVAQLRFAHDPPTDGRTSLCGLPLRQKSGRICWPVQGNGTYWSCEIEAAKLLGCKVFPKAGFRLIQSCECKQFAWMRELFDYRRSIGKSRAGEPIKYGINSGYGKLAQRIGSPKWANLIWAGMITAQTRAWLMEAAASDPSAVVMLATDGIMSIRPLGVDVGDQLGQWEAADHAELMIVQPGVYFGAKKPKTRGVSPAFFDDKPVDYGPPFSPREMFRQRWLSYAEQCRSAYRGAYAEPPAAKLSVNLFIGPKLALARGKPETAGRWVDKLRNFSFDWKAKRGRMEWETLERVWTSPMPGGRDVHSAPHKGTAARLAAEAADLERAELDDQPDHVDLSPVGIE